MLYIRQEKHLARRLNLSVSDLRSLSDSVESYCDELLLLDPAKPGKSRPVLALRSPLRPAQERIYNGILLPHLDSSDYSFGGVRGRHIKLNAEQHLRSRFAFSCDITDFYPSVRHKRVYDFFVDELGCSPDVGRLLTRLCTYHYHLALGLITSPILADQILKPIDVRIAAMARKAGLTYTRYVDDITISGPFDLRNSGIPAAINGILKSSGFGTNEAKDSFGRVGDPEVLITKLRVNRGHLDVSQKYFEDLCHSLLALRGLGYGDDFSCPYYTPGQMWGRVEFVSWVNPGRRRRLRRLFSSVPWRKVREEAERRGLVVCRKKLEPARREDKSLTCPTRIPGGKGFSATRQADCGTLGG